MRNTPLYANLVRMVCYRMTISYDGTEYSGWQVQLNGLSIQELIQDVLGVLLKEPVTVHGSGRTDAGVHALEQVAHFHTHADVGMDKVLLSMNGMLPKAVRILSLEQASETFHARYSASGKEYHYHLFLDRFQSPFDRLYSWHVRRRINMELLKQAAKCFVGTHDFTSFANESHAGSASLDAVRTIRRLDVVGDGSCVRLEFVGDGFLYKMVRNIVGMLIEVSCGKRPIEDISTVLQARDRRLAAQAAPPQGLFLVKVFYPENA